MVVRRYSCKVLPRFRRNKASNRRRGGGSNRRRGGGFLLSDSGRVWQRRSATVVSGLKGKASVLSSCRISTVPYGRSDQKKRNCGGGSRPRRGRSDSSRILIQPVRLPVQMTER
ncbi:hypothetical protein OROGR_001774 [Orobanche gracilis]